MSAVGDARKRLAEAQDVEALAKLLSGHMDALGGSFSGDGEWAWLRCVCGLNQNVPTPGDNIAPAEKVWDTHVAAAILASDWLAARDAEKRAEGFHACECDR